jgi:phage baseplate assembly protein gpV
MDRPDCHLTLQFDNFPGPAEALTRALLRVDLGARIQPDAAAGTVDMEGRFCKEEAIAAIRSLGCRLIRVEEHAPSPRFMGPVQCD